MKKALSSSYKSYNQNCLCKSNTKDLAGIYFDLKKEKKLFYYKHYKKLLKLKKNKKFSENLFLSKNFLSLRLQKLNFELTKKDLTNIDILKNSLIYRNLKQTPTKVKNFKGYTRYYEIVFSPKN